MVVSNRNLLFRWSIFRGYLVSGGYPPKNGELSLGKGLFFKGHQSSSNHQFANKMFVFKRSIYNIYMYMDYTNTFWSEEQNSRDTTEIQQDKLPHDPFCWDIFGEMTSIFWGSNRSPFWWSWRSSIKATIFLWEMFQLDDEPNHNIKQLVVHQTSIKNWMMISSK